MFEVNEYLSKFDLKSGYHHVDIHPEHQKYLGFQWETHDKVKNYVFIVLLFGLSSACYLFTKLMRPLIRHWRGRGLKAIVYLDDGIVATKYREQALRESAQVKLDLDNAGFIVNNEKCNWEPSRNTEWLGFQIDLSVGEFSVPACKIDMLRSKPLTAKEAQPDSWPM